MIESVYIAPRQSGKSTYAKQLSEKLRCPLYTIGKTIPIDNLNKDWDLVVDEFCYYNKQFQDSLIYCRAKLHLVGTLETFYVADKLHNHLIKHFPEAFV